MGSKTKTPFSPTTEQPWAKDEIEGSMAMIESSSRNEQSDLKEDCLRRDHYRCVYSHRWDRKSMQNRKVFPNNKPTFDETTATEAVHILPFGLRDFDEENLQQARYNFTTLYHFEFITKLCNNNIGRNQSYHLVGVASIFSGS